MNARHSGAAVPELLIPQSRWRLSGLPTHTAAESFDVVPANVLHAFRNAGNDPIEFLMITPK